VANFASKEVSMSKWYQTGKDGIKQSKQADEEARQRREQSQGPRRFYLGYDEEARVTFLDDPLFFLAEHTITIGKSHHNHFTCRQGLGTCPVCESGDIASYVCVCTVINHRRYVRDGNVYQHQKQLLVCKGRARQNLLKQFEKKKEKLAWTVWDISRGGQANECNTGESFDFQREVTPSQLAKVEGMIPEGTDAKEFLSPFNYEEIFAPKTEEELRRILGQAPPVGSEEESKESDETPDLFGDSDSGEESKEEKTDTDNLDDLLL
jgi:hypothetical protein